MKIGFSDIRKLVDWSGDLVVLKDSALIDDDAAATVSEVARSATGALRIKLHDKRAALVDLGRHLGLFKERVELTEHNSGPVPTRGESALEIIQRRLAVIRSRRLGREAGSSGEKPAVEDQQAEWGQAPRDE